MKTIHIYVRLTSYKYFMVETKNNHFRKHSPLIFPSPLMPLRTTVFRKKVEKEVQKSRRVFHETVIYVRLTSINI